MRRYVPILVAGSALIAAACRDAVAPTRSATEPTTLSFVGDRSFAAITAASDPNEGTLKFVLLPAGGEVPLGQFTLTYDADAVCDPRTSGYGPATWNRACRTLTAGIEITARYGTDAAGNDYVNFSPDIRFNPEKQVVLSAMYPEIVGTTLSPLQLYLKYTIWYIKKVGKKTFFIDEGWKDRELLTHIETDTGKVRRKIRHFSGFVIRQGDCDPAVDPTCEGGGGTE